MEAGLRKSGNPGLDKKERLLTLEGVDMENLLCPQRERRCRNGAGIPLKDKLHVDLKCCQLDFENG